MAQQLKIIFLVISANGGIYDQLQQCWRKWAVQNHKYIKMFLVHANPGIKETYLQDEQSIVTPRVESLVPGILEKTIDAMTYASENLEFDYLVRTNLSSFWLQEDHLHDYFLRNLTRENCYAGFPGVYKTMLFISGAGIIMSRDVVNRLISNQHLLQKTLPDDVAIGNLVQQQRLSPFTPLQDSRLDMVKFNELPNENDMATQINHIFKNKNVTHVRLKNPDRSIDVTLFKSMLEIQQKLLTS